MGIARWTKNIFFLDDTTFRKLCADNGIDPEDFFDPQAPAALFFNHDTIAVSLDEGSHWMSWEVYDPSAFPTVVREESLVEIDGYFMVYADNMESGETVLYYFPQDYVDAFYEAHPYGSNYLDIGGYSIDLAIRKGDNYVLGIECDGRLYHSSKSARERDYHRQKYLESRGWRIHRIWSTNWWKHPETEITKICNIVGEPS